MSYTTTIVVSKKLKSELDSLKGHPRETYGGVIEKLVSIAKECDESELEVSEETLRAIKQGREDVKKGRVYTSRQLAKELGF